MVQNILSKTCLSVCFVKNVCDKYRYCIVNFVCVLSWAMCYPCFRPVPRLAWTLTWAGLLIFSSIFQATKQLVSDDKRYKYKSSVILWWLDLLCFLNLLKNWKRREDNNESHMDVGIMLISERQRRLEGHPNEFMQFLCKISYTKNQSLYIQGWLLKINFFSLCMSSYIYFF